MTQGEIHCPGDGRHEMSGALYAGQGNENGAVAESVSVLADGFQRQPRLADTAGPDDADQAVVGLAQSPAELL